MKTNSTFTQLFLYLLVGALATLVEWGFFFLFNSVCRFHYQLATVLAIAISTFSNWLFGRLLTFRTAERKNVVGEIAKIYAVSVIGLLMNIAIMFVAVEKIGLSEMLSKIIATGIVFAWNFLVRKLVIYKI